MIAEQQVKIPLASISQKPFEDKPQKKVPETVPREKNRSEEDRRKSVDDKKNDTRKSDDPTPLSKRVIYFITYYIIK